MSNGQKQLIVDYGRRTFVFGISWFTPYDDDTPKKSAIDTIKRAYSTFDLVLIRNEDAPQFALTNRALGTKGGTISAAAALSSNMHNDSWLYALEIEDRIWICNGKNNYILPDGDMIFDDKEEAKAEFLRLEPNRWKSVHVPASWKEPGTFSEDRQRFFESDEIRVSDPQDIFSAQIHKWMRFSPLSPLGGMAKIASTAVVLALLAYFGKDLVFPKAPEMAKPNLDATTAMLAERANAERQSAYQEFDSKKPWTSAPRAIDLSKACIKIINEMPAAAAGYRTHELNCEGGSVSAILTRGDDTYASWLQEWADTHDNFDIDIARDGSQAYIVKDIQQLDMRGDEPIKNYSYVSSILMEAASIEGSSLEVSDPVAYKYEDYPDYIPLYGTSEITVSTTRPSAWLSTFEKVGGITISSISLTPATMTYNFRGQIYVSNR